MKRLLWKEMRERWVMLLIWAAGIITVMLIGYSKYFFGVSDYYEDIDPAYIILVLAAFTGGSAYASELSQNRAEFAFSRPIPWWKLMTAKFLPGIIVAVLSPIIAFTIFYFFIKNDYHSYLISSNIILGIWNVIWQNALAFTICFFCSSVLPGFASGFLTAVIICMPLSGISFMIINAPKYYPNNDGILLCMIGGAIAGFIAGGILISQYFAKIDIPSRFLNLGIIVVIFYFAGVTGGVFYGYYGPYKKGNIEQINEENINYYYSPGGRYATIENSNSPDNYIFKHSIDLETGKNLQLVPDYIKNVIDINWLTDDMLLISTTNHKTTKIKSYQGPDIYIHQISKNITKLIDRSYSFRSVSPDNDYLLMRYRKSSYKVINGKRKYYDSITILSFPDMKKVTTINMNFFINYEWQGDNTLLYYDGNGNEKILRLK